MQQEIVHLVRENQFLDRNMLLTKRCRQLYSLQEWHLRVVIALNQ